VDKPVGGGGQWWISSATSVEYPQPPPPAFDWPRRHLPRNPLISRRYYFYYFFFSKIRRKKVAVKGAVDNLAETHSMPTRRQLLSACRSLIGDGALALTPKQILELQDTYTEHAGFDAATDEQLAQLWDALVRKCRAVEDSKRPDREMWERRPAAKLLGRRALVAGDDQADQAAAGA